MLDYYRARRNNDPASAPRPLVTPKKAIPAIYIGLRVYIHDDPNRAPQLAIIVGPLEKLANGTELHPVYLVERDRVVVMPDSSMTPYCPSTGTRAFPSST